jgi:hypothetical protein
MLGAVTSALALAAVALVLWAGIRGRVRAVAGVLLLALIIGGDLWINARPFWTYTTLDQTLYRPDAIVERIKAGPSPTRVLDLSRIVGQPVYPGNTLMVMNVPQLLGEHGLEVRYFDDVLGGHNAWRNLGNLRLWDLFAVRWVVTPSRMQGLDSIPGYKRVQQGTTGSGAPADLYERTEPAPYAHVVTGALAVDSLPLMASLQDPRMAFDRLVLLDAGQGIRTPPLTGFPLPSASRAAIEHWEPGRMTIALEPPPPDSSYLVVAENWYPDWRATVDGSPAIVLRGNWTLITVRVPPGARQVDLTFISDAYRRGKLLTWVSLVLTLGLIVTPVISRRWGQRRAA